MRIEYRDLEPKNKQRQRNGKNYKDSQYHREVGVPTTYSENSALTGMYRIQRRIEQIKISIIHHIKHPEKILKLVVCAAV